MHRAPAKLSNNLAAKFVHLGRFCGDQEIKLPLVELLNQRLALRNPRLKLQMVV